VSGAQHLFRENPRELCIFDPGRTHNRSRCPRFEASGQENNVDKGSRQIRFVTLGKELALKVGSRGSTTRDG